MAVELGFGLAPDAKSAAEQFIAMLNGQAVGVQKLSEAITNFNANGDVISQTFRAIASTGESVVVTLKEQQGAWQLLSGKVDEATSSLKALEAQEKAVQAASRRSDAQSAEQQLGGLLNRPGLNVNQVSGMEGALQRIKAQIESGAVSLQRFQELYNQVSSNPRALIPNLTTEEAQITAALRSIMTGLTNTGKTAADIAQKWYISWQGVVRLIEAQVVKRIAGFLQSGFAEGISSAAEFSIKIAEIETISQKANVTTSEWTNGIRALSSQFGNTQADVAEAAYQAVSNQVVKGTETFDFMATALKFARASVSSATDSVNLLSSALQSYGESSGEAERVAAVLFKTIELGRVRAKDLADTFGRVGPSAAQLGVKLEDVAAAIATITTKGVKPAEVLTLINNLILKLIKPTNEMKALFQEWGVASGAAAVQTFGFAGVLQRLDDEAQKGGSRLGDLLGQIRAIRAAVSLTGNSFGDFSLNRENIVQGQAEFDRAADIVGASFGQRLQVQLNRAKVYFAEDFGDSLIRTSVRIVESFGGLDNILKTITSTLKPLVVGYAAFTTALVAGKAVFTAWDVASGTATARKIAEAAAIATATTATTANTAAVATATAATTSYAVALNSINIFAATFAAAYTLGNYLISEADVDRADRLRNQLEKIATLRQVAGTQDPQRQFDRNDTKDTISRYETLYQAISTYYAKQNILANDTKNRAIENTKAVTEQTKASVVAYTGAITQQITAMREVANQARSIINSSLKLAEDLPRKLSGDLFKEQLKYADPGHLNPATGLVVDNQQIELIKKKIVEITTLARTEYSKGTKESIDEARKLWNEAEKLETELFDKQTQIRRKEFDDAVSKGKIAPTKFEYDPAKDQLQPIYEFKVKTADLEAKLNAMLQERLKLEADVRANAAQQLKTAQEQELAEKERLKTIQQALTAITQINVFGKQGALKPEYVQDPGKALVEFDRQAEIIRAAAAQRNLEVQIQSAQFLNEQRKALEQEVQAALTQQQLKGEQDRTTIALNASTTRIKKIQSDIEAATQQISNEVRKISIAVGNTSLDLPKTSDDVWFRAQNLFGDFEAMTKLTKEVKALQAAAQAATDAFNVNTTQANLEKAQTAIKSYTDEARKLLALKQGKDVLDLDPKDEAVQRIREVELAAERLQDSFAARNTARDAMDAAQVAANDLGSKVAKLPNIYQIFTETVAKSSPVAVSSLESINQKTVEMIGNLNIVIERMNAIRDALPAVQQGATLGNGPRVGTELFGRGPAYMNAGGFVPRGSDTEPAMISRKEMVMNAYAVDTFEPILRAMNSGSLRGSDYSKSQTINIGDIHVHGGTTESGSVRNIAKSLRREIRRGTVSLT